MKVFDSILETIGKTPLLRLNNIEKELHLHASLYAKIEAFNPGGSVKDRIALNMIEKAEASGKLLPGSTIIEPTSGNTGIGLAMIGAAKGYKVILVMPDTASVERRKIMKAFNATLILTEGSKGIPESIRVAENLAKDTLGSYMPYQFKNPANPETHYFTTAKEIYEDLDGLVDCFVAGIGTGGTISGVGKYLKEKSKTVYIVGLEPKDSPVISQGQKGSHKIQGIGAGFIPDTLNQTSYDEIITISNQSAFEYAKMLSAKEGILAGISSGAALAGAVQLAKRREFDGKKIVLILPDTGERYLSTELFD